MGRALGQGAQKVPDQRLIPEVAGQMWGKSPRKALESFFVRAADPVFSIDLEPPTRERLVALLDSIKQCHSEAYGSPATVSSAAVLDSVGEAPVRTRIRALVEALDHEMTYGGIPLLHASALAEHPMEEIPDEPPAE